MKRICLTLLCGMLAGQACAIGLKIGVVNMDQVVQKSPLAISYNEKLSSEFSSRQDAINAAQKKLQDDANQLTFNGFKLTAAERSTMQEAVANDKRDLDALTASFQKDLAAEQSKYTQQLMSQLNDLINKIAKSGGFDMIQTSANVIYLNSALDVTPLVIQQLK